VKLTSKKTLTEILHILIALELILAYLYALNIFKPSYFILIRGVIWAHDYEFKPLGRGFYGLIALIVIALTLAIYLFKAGGFKAVKPSRLALYVLTALTLINIPPLIYWILYALDPNPLEHTLRQYVWVSELDASIFYVYAPVYPILILVTLYAWLPPVIGRAFKSRVKLSIRCSKALGRTGDHKSLDNTFIERFGLVSALLLSIALPLIPYLPSINPTFKPASVDIRYYAMFLDDLLARDPLHALEYAFYSGLWCKILYLLMLYGLVGLGIPREAVLNFEALLTAPLLTLAVYFFAKRLSGEGSYAALASLAAVLGFNMTVNMFGGFFANWAALTLFYACIGLTPSLIEGDVKSLVLCVIASTATFYTHTWTWSILMATLTAYLALSTLESLRNGRLTVNKHLLTLLIVNATVDLLKNSLTPGREGLTESAETLSRSVRFENLQALHRNLQRLYTSYLGGLLSNPLHMLLALIGILSMFKRRGEYSKLILIWVAVASTPFLFVNVALQSRLLLVMPFPILIAEGLRALSRLLARFNSKLPRLLQAFFITSSLTYTVRALCNLI
jgi:hypothetical protein